MISEKIAEALDMNIDDVDIDLTVPEDAELTKGFGGKTMTTWGKGHLPWNKGKKMPKGKSRNWTDEQKKEASERMKQIHKERGHTSGGKKYERKGRVDNTTELNKTEIKCPHCNKTGNIGNMKRWHFDNCKAK